MDHASSCGKGSGCCQNQGHEPAPQPEGQDGACCTTRRDFLVLTAGGMAAVGAAGAAWPLIDSMNPAADTLALATVEVDVAGVAEGQAITKMWRGKPVFIRHRTAVEVEEARKTPLADLKHPQTDEARTASSVFEGKAMPQWLVTLGSCTHLGCIPLGQKAADPRGEFGGWFCPCHGSQYDTSGRIRKGPAPYNLEVPPYAFIGPTRIRIG